LIIKKGKIFKLGEQKVISTKELHINSDEKGVFILNMWTQCDIADINVLLVDYVNNLSDCDLYVLKKDNVIIGGVKDICLK